MKDAATAGRRSFSIRLYEVFLGADVKSLSFHCKVFDNVGRLEGLPYAKTSSSKGKVLQSSLVSVSFGFTKDNAQLR
jgi:hypothetical protein